MKVPEANKTRFDDRIYLIGETKLCIKQNTQIAYNKIIFSLMSNLWKILNLTSNPIIIQTLICSFVMFF